MPLFLLVRGRLVGIPDRSEEVGAIIAAVLSSAHLSDLLGGRENIPKA